MHNHTSIELLKTFSKDELINFGKFISSPFYNKNRSLIRLFNIIKKCSPEYTGKNLKKENLYNRLYPGKKFNLKTLRSRMADFSLLVKRFLIISGIEKDEFLTNLTLAKEYRRRTKLKLANKIITDALTGMEKSKIYNLDYFRNSIDLLDQQNKLLIASDMKPEALKLAIKRGEHSMNYFLNHLLQMNDELIKNNIEHKDNSEINFIEMLLKKIDMYGLIEELGKMKYKYYPYLAINFYTNKSITNPEDERYFYKLKELIFDNYRNFSLTTVYNYWSMLSNAVIINYLNKGNKFLQEGHEINKFFIENRLFDPNKPLSAHAYQNTVVNALLVKDIDWCERFVESYKDSLTKDSRENRYNFCKAMVEFEKKCYESSIKYLNKVKHADWHFKITARLYYLKNYYELGLHSQMFLLIDSLKHMVQDNPELPEYVDERISKSLYFIGKIAGAKFDGKSIGIDDIKEAEKIKYYNHKEWIIEKMKELIN